MLSEEEMAQHVDEVWRSIMRLEDYARIYPGVIVSEVHLLKDAADRLAVLISNAQDRLERHERGTTARVDAPAD